jgi:hypothetical protein
MLIVKTERGHQVMKDRSVALTPKQRSALIVFDGKRTLEDAITAAGVTREEIDKLLELGLIASSGPVAAPAAQSNTPEVTEAAQTGGHRTPKERYAEAYPIATKLTASLGLRGFRLNLAVEGATNYEELLKVAPKIREAVGAEKFQALELALSGA